VLSNELKEEYMRVFISWSGKSSRRIAEALQNWLPKIFHNNVDLWVSNDIEQGSNWVVELAKGLEQSQFGILCMTADNLESSWMLFEAGAISMAETINNKRYVCPYLFGINSQDLPQALSQFQTARANEEGTYKLVHTINDLQERPFIETMLREEFEEHWPALEEVLKSIPVQKRCIRVGYGKIKDLVDSHRESVLCNIFHKVLEDTLHRVKEERYDFDELFIRVYEEIRKSRELYRGFCTKNAGKDLCEFLEERFTKDELKGILKDVEHILLAQEDLETKRDKAASYTEAIGGEVFSRLTHELYDLEH
jgi:hypothetical protein